MRTSAIIRCAVVVLAVVLGIDAICCGDGQLSGAHGAPRLASAGDAGGGNGSMDCHACICSGLALIETSRANVPSLESALLDAYAAAHPMSEVSSIDTPPHERA